jgi:hypothetical protein
VLDNENGVQKMEGDYRRIIMKLSMLERWLSTLSDHLSRRSRHLGRVSRAGPKAALRR